MLAQTIYFTLYCLGECIHLSALGVAFVIDQRESALAERSLDDLNKLAIVHMGAAIPKPKPRWDVHLPEVGDQAGSLAGGLRPLLAGRCGSGA